MKLNDVYTKPLKDVVEELNLTDMKVHTDDDGEVRSIELKYEPNNRRHPADADEEKHPERASGMEPGKMSDLRTGMLETNVKTGDPAEENASSLHRVRTQNRK